LNSSAVILLAGAAAGDGKNVEIARILTTARSAGLYWRRPSQHRRNQLAPEAANTPEFCILISFRTTSPHLILMTALAANAQSASAQTPPAFSVSVTEPYELVEEVGTTRRITRADIEARNARTLDEALKLLPGVYVRTGGDGTPRIDIRGFRSRHILLLINGVQVNSSADGQFDPARISTRAIRDIKVSYGSSSVLYGDNAMAAVIEITTVDDAEDATLEAIGGAPSQGGAGARYAKALGQWSLMATSTGYSSNGFRLPDSFVPTPLEDGDRRQNSDRDRADIRGAIGYRPSAAVSIASEWFFGSGTYGVPGGTVADTTDIFAPTPRFERVEDYDTASGQISLVVAPWQRFNVRAWAFRNTQREDRARYDDASYASMDDPLVQGTFRSRERTSVTGASVLGRLDLEKFGWMRMAANQRREAFDSRGVIRDVSVGAPGGGGGGRGGGGAGSRPPTFDVRTFSVDQHVDVYSTGAEWQVYPATRFGAVLGAGVNVQERPGSDAETAPTWLAGVSYEVTDDVRLHVSGSRKIRVPSIDQLFNASSGNPGLRSERADGVDGGVDYTLDPTSTVAVSVFSTHARDFIERPPGLPFENQDRYRFSGVEVTVQTTKIPQLSLRGGYSFLDSVAETSNATRPLQTRPRHRGSLEWMWIPVNGSAVRGAAYYTGTQLYDSRGAVPVQMNVDGYLLVDLGFTQTLARRYDLAFDVTNLFDELYEQSYGLPREGRAAVVTLRARLN
jgi:outer membrane cobalamin receptor